MEISIINGNYSGGVVFLAKDTGRCLLQLRNSDKRFKHTWGFWGGILEGTETPYECIQRELEEEIGFVPELQKLDPIDVFQSKPKYASVVNLIGKTNFSDLASLSSGARLILGNDTGPMHLLVACSNEKIPKFVLFGGASDPTLCAPIGNNVTIIKENNINNIISKNVKNLINKKKL